MRNSIFDVWPICGSNRNNSTMTVPPHYGCKTADIEAKTHLNAEETSFFFLLRTMTGGELDGGVVWLHSAVAVILH